MTHQTSPVCRLCLEPQAVSTMVLLNEGDHFVDSIRQITSVEVLLGNSDYTVYMCPTCQDLLEQCIRFRDRCLRNDDLFRKSYLIKEEQADGGDDDDDGGVGDIKFELIMSPVEDDDPVPERIPRKRGRKRKKPIEDVPPKVEKKRKKRADAGEAQPDRTEQCQHCGKLMKPNALRAHLHTHNPDRTRFECSYCGKVFFHSRQLKNHVNCAHTHETQYSCDRCGKTYERSDSLKKHFIAEHTDEKRYECRECGLRFARSTARLYHHQMVHQVGRPYQCEYCEKAFKRKADIILHTRTHTGEKPFKCDICFKAFSKSYNVVIHKKSHRNEAIRLAAAAAASVTTTAGTGSAMAVVDATIGV